MEGDCSIGHQHSDGVLCHLEGHVPYGQLNG